MEIESSFARKLSFLQYLTEDSIEGVMNKINIQYLCLNMMINCDKARTCENAVNQYLYCSEGLHIQCLVGG